MEGCHEAEAVYRGTDCLRANAKLEKLLSSRTTKGGQIITIPSLKPKLPPINPLLSRQNFDVFIKYVVPRETVLA